MNYGLVSNTQPYSFPAPVMALSHDSREYVVRYVSGYAVDLVWERVSSVSWTAESLCCVGDIFVFSFRQVEMVVGCVVLKVREGDA